MRDVRGIIILTAAATLFACAAQPPTVPALPPVTALPGDTAVPTGYQHYVTKDGTEIFCRDDTVTGSRAQHEKVCLTAAQLKASQENGQNFLNGVQGSDVGAAGAGLGGYTGHGGGAVQR
jgi:hypothetical protein